MKTYNTTIQGQGQFNTDLAQQYVPAVVLSIREISALLAAVTIATGVVLLSIWAAGLGIREIIGAASWGVAFIFFGLAIGNPRPVAILQLFSGLSLLVLAWLQYSISTDFTIISGVLMAAWAAVALFRQLKQED